MTAPRSNTMAYIFHYNKFPLLKAGFQQIIQQNACVRQSFLSSLDRVSAYQVPTG